MPGHDPAARPPLLYDVPELAAGAGVRLLPANGEHAEALSRLMRDREVMLQTGSVHSTERADRIASGEDTPEYTIGQLEEIYERWSVAEDRAVWVIEAEGEVVVDLEVYDHNPRARRLYERIGFVHEGTLRDALRLDDRWVDAHLMSLLRPEWDAQGGGAGAPRP